MQSIKRTINCLKCSIEFKLGTHYNQKFCGRICEKEYKKNEHYNYYLNNQSEFYRVRNMSFIKPHILREQDSKCAICTLKNEWMDKILVFILDHINGDASNNSRNNLRLICPNCDSQLDTYKSKNKNSARKTRYPNKIHT